MDSTETTTVLSQEHAKRADTFLAGELGRSRSYFAALIESGHVLRNGKPLKKSDPVRPGDSFTLSFPEEASPDITPKEISFETVWETPRYAVIHKPAGLTVHPAPGHYDDSLVSGLLYKFHIDDDCENFRPGIVHRLDKDTSGLLIITKDRRARELFHKIFYDRNIEKYYLAVASGNPAFHKISLDAPIARDKIHRKRMCIDPAGRAARTDVTVKEIFPGAFLADIRLYTGRTHQIRVHMKHIKHPLLGDSLYGGKTAAALFHRQALHARRLVFIDPFTNENVDISVPPPQDMQELIDNLRK